MATDNVDAVPSISISTPSGSSFPYVFCAWAVLCVNGTRHRHLVICYLKPDIMYVLRYVAHRWLLTQSYGLWEAVDTIFWFMGHVKPGRVPHVQTRARTKKWKEEPPPPPGPNPPPHAPQNPHFPLFQCRWKPELGA